MYLFPNLLLQCRYKVQAMWRKKIEYLLFQIFFAYHGNLFYGIIWKLKDLCFFVYRIAAAPYLSHLIVNGDFFLASCLFVYAGATDFLDGYIARNFKNQASSLGSFLDPLSDKILVCTAFLSLTYANLIPASLTGLIVSRDLFLVYAGLYIRYMSVVPPFTFKKYFDPRLPTATVQPTTISKINTALQFLLIAVSLGAPLVHLQNHPYLHYLWAATGTTTFLSAVSYAFMKVHISSLYFSCLAMYFRTHISFLIVRMTTNLVRS